WEPMITHETLRFKIARWIDLAGQVAQWDSPYDKRTGEPNGAFYVFEHADILQATLKFIERDGIKFRFTWDGSCNVFYGKTYGENVPFHIDDWATFAAV